VTLTKRDGKALSAVTSPFSSSLQAWHARELCCARSTTLSDYDVEREVG